MSAVDKILVVGAGCAESVAATLQRMPARPCSSARPPLRSTTSAGSRSCSSPTTSGSSASSLTVAVLDRGQIMNSGPVEAVTRQPHHPYTANQEETT